MRRGEGGAARARRALRTRPLRICFVAYRGNMRCGGQGVYLWFLARELARQGHRVDVLVGPPYPDPMPFARDVARLPNHHFWAKWFARDWARFLPQPNALEVFRPLHFYELAASRLGFLPEPFAFSARSFGQLARRLRRGERYDLVHDVQCLGYGLLAVRALGIPVVTTIHHPLSVDRRTSFARDETLVDAVGTAQFYPVGMQAFVARRLARVLTSSTASAERIRRDFRVPPERIRMLGNGVDTELYRPDERVARREHELVCVGRASDPNKGIRPLLEALRRLPEPVRLTLVDDTPPGTGAQKWARRLGCDERLEVAGPVTTPELVNLYRRAALVVVPSRYEGFGLPAAEAMACGSPVVATHAGALGEVVRAGGGGVLVPPDDPEALAKTIAALLEQPATRRALGAPGRAGIEANFSWRSVATRTAEAYWEVLEERSSRRAGSSAASGLGSAPAARPAREDHDVSQRG